MEWRWETSPPTHEKPRDNKYEGNAPEDERDEEGGQHPPPPQGEPESQPMCDRVKPSGDGPLDKISDITEFSKLDKSSSLKQKIRPRVLSAAISPGEGQNYTFTYHTKRGTQQISNVSQSKYITKPSKTCETEEVESRVQPALKCKGVQGGS